MNLHEPATAGPLMDRVTAAADTLIRASLDTPVGIARLLRSSRIKIDTPNRLVVRKVRPVASSKKRPLAIRPLLPETRRTGILPLAMDDCPIVPAESPRLSYIKERDFIRIQKEEDKQREEALVARAVDALKAELPNIIQEYVKATQPVPVPEEHHILYLNQIAAAQEFLNDNRSADLSRVKCLLHKMLPREYYDTIETLKEQQDPKIIFEINGGNNVIAPSAQTVEQKKNTCKEKKRKRVLKAK